MSTSNLISLGGLEFVMTYRGSTQERRDNLLGVLRHITRTYCEYTLYLIEGDVTPRFDWAELSDPNIRHVFVFDEGPFSRAKLCNLGARMCHGSVICFHDADMIANPAYLPLCVNSVRHGSFTDAFCPFLRVINISDHFRDAFIETSDYASLEPYLETDLPDGMRLLYENTAGAIIIFKRSEYIRIGGYDPRFIGWGGEDDDLLTRAQRLGVRWHSVPDDKAALFHLNHDSNSRMAIIAASERNRLAAEETHTISQEALEARAAELSKYFS